MKVTTNRWVALGFVSALGIVLAMSAMPYRSARNYESASLSVGRTQEVLAELAATLSSVKDTESGERGFVITGDERFLEPHEAAVSRLHGQINRLDNLTARDPYQQSQLSLLKQKVKAKLKVGDANVQARRTEGVEAASRLVATGRGKMAMDEIRKLIEAMEKHESELLERCLTDSRRAASRATYTILFLALLSVLLLSVPFYVIQRDFSKRRKTEVALQDANEKLSVWVKELERRSREISLLSQLGNLLQSCLSADEAHRVVVQQAKALFPTESGALCVLSPSRDTVEVVAEWGDSPPASESSHQRIAGRCAAAAPIVWRPLSRPSTAPT